MRVILQLAYAAVAIAGLVAIQVAVLYALGWVVLAAFRFVPMIGRRHKHRDWERLNR